MKTTRFTLRSDLIPRVSHFEDHNIDLGNTADDSLECSGYQSKEQKDNQSIESKSYVNNLHSILATLPLQSGILEASGFMESDEG